MSRLFSAMSVGLILFTAAWASTHQPAAAADLASLIAPGAEVKKIADGFRFTEGPAFGPQGFLVFSDIPNDRIVRLRDDGTTEDFLKPSGGSNGLMFDRMGKLHACQGVARRVVSIDVATGNKVTVLAESFGGKKLNSPNDLALDTHGGLYFTDPQYGRGEPAEQPVMGVYYIDSAGQVTRVIEDLERPNGILVSPNGKLLYVAEHGKGRLHRYDILAPGKVSKGALIFTGDPELDGSGPDGMAHDVQGNVYGTYKGITVLDPDGKVIGRIPVPERPTNCEFGGKDGKTLYITARTSLYALPTLVAGMAFQPSGPGGGPAVAPAAARLEVKTREVKLKWLKLHVPESWKEKPSSSPSRLGEFEIAAASGDREPAELVVYYFGKGQGGGRQANIDRWIKQFAPEGRESKVFSGKSAVGEYALVDVSGTYNKSIGPPIQGKTETMMEARMLAIVLTTGEGDVFLKLTGPQKTVTAAAADLRRAIGVDPAAEQAEKAP